MLYIRFHWYYHWIIFVFNGSNLKKNTKIPCNQNKRKQIKSRKCIISTYNPFKLRPCDNSPFNIFLSQIKIGKSSSQHASLKSTTHRGQFVACCLDSTVDIKYIREKEGKKEKGDMPSCLLYAVMLDCFLVFRTPDGVLSEWNRILLDIWDML
jgi:hypothetical protein